MTEFNNTLPTEVPAEDSTALEVTVTEPAVKSEAVLSDESAPVESLAEAEDSVVVEDCAEVEATADTNDTEETAVVEEADEAEEAAEVEEADDIAEAEDTVEVEDIAETEDDAEVEEADDTAEDIPVVCPDDLSDLEFDEYFASISIPDFEDVPDDDDRYVSNSSRMRTFLQEKETAAPTPEPAPPAKKSFRSVISNFIYYHKILSALIVIAVIVGAVWGINAYSRSRIDYNIGIYTEDTKFTGEQLSSIEQSLAAYGKDLNGDGKVIVKARTYKLGEDSSNFLIYFFCLERDIYGDAKHGSRLNDILITDEAVSEVLCKKYTTNFFDELNDGEYWVNISDSVLPDDLSDDLGIMLLSRNMYVEREISVPQYNNAKGLLEEMDKQNRKLFDF